MLNKQLLKDRGIGFVAILLFAILFQQSMKEYGSERVVPFIILSMVIPAFFNRIARHYSWSRSIFESRLNIYTSIYTDHMIIDLPLDDSYDKFLEVIENTELRIQKSDTKTHQIVALTRAGWTTVGENLYFKFTQKGEKTKLQFQSVSFKIFDRNTHIKNLHAIINQFEESLTI